MSFHARTGVHVLHARSVVRALVTAADLGPGDLVLDLGAGPGTFTAPLAATGARVLAVERNPGFVRTLERRFGDDPNVRVVHADLRDIPFPGRPFQVVASIPYALSSPLLDRLLGVRHPTLQRADLVVEWGFAKRLVESGGDRPRTRRWSRRFGFEIARRIPAHAFSPRPRVASAHLVVSRR